jgi:class 3 adenylate cyclase
VAETASNATDGNFVLKFLGRSEIRLGTEWSASPVFDKAAALLSWLSVSGGFRSRSEISSLLWPDFPERRGRANLSQLLLVISRRSGDESPVEKERDALRLALPPDENGKSRIDVLEFLSDTPPPGCSRLHAPARCSRCRERILFRQSLYRGEFLQGESLPDALPFRIWVEETRKKLSDRKNVLDRLLAGRIEPFPLTTTGGISREWRPLTVLCVLVRGKENLAAEDILESIEHWRRSAETIVRNRGGELEKFRKPGLLAYFGYPLSREEDTRMAATSALEILESFSRFQGNGNLEIRAIVHSGTAACDLVRGIPDATGERTDETDFLIQQAPAGRAVATETAMARLKPSFRTNRWGRGSLPRGGFLNLHILEPAGNESSYDRLLIGRGKELATLQKIWEKAAKGEQRSIWITGEPGIGKSALTNAFVRSVRMNHRNPGTVLRFFCLPEFRDTPWFPVRRFLRDTVGSAHMATSDALRFLSEVRLPDEELLPEEKRLFSRNTLPEERRQKTEEILLDVLLETAQPSPLLVVVEDIHWSDYATLSLLRRMLSRRSPSPAMLLLTCRSGKIPSFLPFPDAGDRLELLPLNRKQSRTLVEQAVPGLSPAHMRSILDLGDGIPLYLHELATAGKDEHSPLTTPVPAGIQNLMAARIDLLEGLRELALVAACIGQSVPAGLLTEVGVEGWDNGRILSGIDTLLERGVLEKDSDNPPTFVFHHALLREALLASLPPSFLRKTHGRIAVALRARFGEWIDREPEFLAVHLAQAGECDEAITTWIEASEKATARGYPEHAREHLEHALGLVPGIEDPFKRRKREQEVLTALAQASWFTHGVGSDYVHDICQRRDAIFDTLEVSKKTFPVFYSLWATTNARYGLQESRKFLERLEEARHLPDLSTADTCQIQFALGENALWRGCLDQAGRFFEGCIDRRRTASPAPPSFFTVYGEDSAVQSLASLALVRWQQGFGLTALDLVRQAAGIAKDVSHPGPLGHALNYELYLRLFRNEPDHVLDVSRRALEWAERHGFYQWKVLALLARGWAQGDPEGYRLAREIGAAIREIVPGLSSAPALVEAGAALRAHMPEEALHVVIRAREDAEEKGIRLFYPEFFRLEGEARRLLNPSDATISRRLFLEAIGIARKEGAAMLALKALLSYLKAFPGEAVPARDVLDNFPREEGCAELDEALLLSGLPDTSPPLQTESGPLLA